MVRCDQEWVSSLAERPRTIYLGGSSTSVVSFLKARDKWVIRHSPLLDIPFLEERQAPRVPVQVTVSKAGREPGALRGKGVVVSSLIRSFPLA